MVNFYALREKIIMMAPYSLTIITVHNSSCGKVMFSQVRVKILSTGGDTPSLGRHPPQADTHPPTPEMATAVDGTHPTWMHSVLFYSIFTLVKCYFSHLLKIAP